MFDINVFFLGGAGSISASGFVPPPWATNVNYISIDTSESESKLLTSDVIDKLDLETILITDNGIHGSGGVRGFKNDLINTSIDSVLLKYQDAEINILVYSGSGASGSMLAYHITDRLLPTSSVIHLCSQSTSSLTRTNNALKNIISLDKLTNTHGKSISMGLYEPDHHGFKAMDTYIRQDLSVLLAFTSDEVIGVDSADLRSLMAPETIPDISADPKLYILRVTLGDTYDDTHHPVTILTLSDIGGIDDIQSNSAITYSGALPLEVSDIITDGIDSNVISLSLIDTASEFISTIGRKAEKLQKARHATKLSKSNIDIPNHITPTGDGPLL